MRKLTLRFQKNSSFNRKVGRGTGYSFLYSRELLTQQEEKEKLKNELAAVKAELEKIESVVYRTPSYWVVNDDQEDDGPYCQPCFDDERKLIRLQGGNNDLWNCRKCKNSFKGPNYVTPPKRVRRSSTWSL